MKLSNLALFFVMVIPVPSFAFSNQEAEACRRARVNLQDRQEDLTEARDIQGAAPDLCGNDTETATCRQSIYKEFKEYQLRHRQAVLQVSRSCL